MKAGETRALSIQAREKAIERARAYFPVGSTIYAITERGRSGGSFRWVRFFAVLPTTRGEKTEPEIHEVTFEVACVLNATRDEKHRGAIKTQSDAALCSYEFACRIHPGAHAQEAGYTLRHTDL